MKTVLRFTVIFCAFWVFQIDLKAQDPVSVTNTDQSIRQLTEIVRIIEQVNGLPVDFKKSSAEILPRSLPNLQKQAALLKQLPKGTVVEIGVHSNGHYDIFLRDVMPEHPTIKRAEAIRRELVRLGVSADSLTAKGYGAEKPIDASKPSVEDPKNERVEFLVEKMPENGSKSAIVSGKGWDKIVIGATRWDVEDVLGEPEKFYEGNMLLPDPSAQYFSRGLIVVYGANTETVKSIDFVGNPAFLDAGSYVGTFRAVDAKPDKNILWGANAAQIIKAYGEPRHKLIEKRNGAEVVTLTYDQIVFTFNTDKLFYIVVSANNDRFLAARKKAEEEKPLSQITEGKPLVYNVEHTIIPGKGAGVAVLGATRAAIEAAFGQPNEFVDEKNDLFPIYEAHYFSKGIQIEYDPKTKTATSISFFGDTAKTLGFKKYKLFPGITDKTVRWGVSPAEVIKAYGKPVEERMRYNPKIDKDYEFITYPNVAFGFAENRLVYIANNPIWGKPK